MDRWSKLKSNLLGTLKDKASMGKLLARSDNLDLHLAVLRATSHESCLPPEEKHVVAILSAAGYGSRTTASVCVEALMNRLHKTHSCDVALKSLIIIHRIVKQGSFILLDQLTVYPASGGRNYLNLANFRNSSTPESWQLSSWIRWYARVLEQLLLASRVLGYFFAHDGLTKQESVTALTNLDLLKESEALVGVLGEICQAPPQVLEMSGNLLVREMLRWVLDDTVAAIGEISVRIDEGRERVRFLSFGEAVELILMMKKVEEYEAGMEGFLSMGMVLNRAQEMEESKAHLLSSARELKQTLNALFIPTVCGGYGQKGWIEKRGEKVSQSERYGNRSMKQVDTIRCLSHRSDGFPDSEITFPGCN